MFTDPDKPFVSHPVLKSKAAECKHFIPALSIIRRAVSDGSELHERGAYLMEKLAAFGRLMDESPMFPSDEQASRAMKLMRDFLRDADWLNQHAIANDNPCWHIVYKHHFFQRLAEKFKLMNLRFAWCFKAEDYVGKIAVLAHSCSFGTRSIDLPGKILTKWRLMLHFKILHELDVE